VHLQIWTLSGANVILSEGANLTMTLDKNGILWDQNGDVGIIASDGSIQFISPSSVTASDISGPWISNSTENAEIIPPSGLAAYGCSVGPTTYGMFAFASSPTSNPSCTVVALQVDLILYL
jgi:hypothetical protein